MKHREISDRLHRFPRYTHALMDIQHTAWELLEQHSDTAPIHAVIEAVLTNDHCLHKVRRPLAGVGQGKLDEGGSGVRSADPVKVA